MEQTLCLIISWSHYQMAAQLSNRTQWLFGRPGIYLIAYLVLLKWAGRLSLPQSISLYMVLSDEQSFYK